jgi:hypothetical protein
MTSDDHPHYEPPQAETPHAASRRRLAALASLAELSGGRGEVTGLVDEAGSWLLVLGGPAGEVRVRLRGVGGGGDARRALAACDRMVLAEVTRTESVLRVRLAWVGGLVDLTAQDWAPARP